MSTASVYVPPPVEKQYPISEGMTAPRKKVPKILAIINDQCTGCAGSPVCVEYCPVGECMYWVPDSEGGPFGTIEVDPMLCIGCKLCVAKGPDGTFLEACPWDAIDMVPVAEWEALHGKMPEPEPVKKA